MVAAPVIRLFRGAAQAVAQRGQTLVSGATPGAEQLAVETALAAQGRVRLFLPWARYEAEWLSRLERRYPGRIELKTEESATLTEWRAAVLAEYPEGERLAPGSLALLARYYGMMEHVGTVVVMPYVRMGRPTVERASDRGRGKIGGIAFGSPVQEPVADKGGAELPLRFARALRLNCYDLSDEGHQELLAESFEIFPDRARGPVLAGHR